MSGRDESDQHGAEVSLRLPINAVRKGQKACPPGFFFNIKKKNRHLYIISLHSDVCEQIFIFIKKKFYTVTFVSKFTLTFENLFSTVDSRVNYQTNEQLVELKLTTTLVVHGQLPN